MLIFLIFMGCSPSKQEANEMEVMAFVGARIIDGTGADPIEGGVLLITNGKILEVGSQQDIEIPAGAQVMDVKGKVIMPGIINAHGHVGIADGLESGYSRENVIRDLEVNARYGVTTIVSLGNDEQPSAQIRNEQNTLLLTRSRLFLAGEVVTGETPEAVKEAIDRNVNMGVDFIKIRVDDNLGNSKKMPAEIYQTVINYSHELGYRVASHIFYLEDAKTLLRTGTDYIAHSVRDRGVDQEFIDLMNEAEVYYCPTLMREVSTFVFASEPDYFSDPFFTKEVDSGTIAQLRDPERMNRVASSTSAKAYRIALDTALMNLKKLADAGVTIVMGTDSGVSGRFPGYFEHLEMEMMVDAGMTPMEVIVASTGGSAKALKLEGLGSLQPGNWADFIVLDQDPLTDIKNTRSISSVWIAGNKIEESAAPQAFQNNFSSGGKFVAHRQADGQAHSFEFADIGL